MSTVATGTFTRLFTAAVQRGASTLFQKIARLRKIDLSLKGEVRKNPVVAQAVQDFEIVLGTYRGEYDTYVDEFLADIAQSGLICAIAENALIGRTSDELKALFEARFACLIPGHPISPSTLYEQLSTSFAITIRELTKDPLLTDIVRTSHTHIAQRLDEIDATIQNFTDPHNQSRRIDHSDKIKICRSLANSYKNVRIETVTSGAKEVSIDKIYIVPRLIHRTFGSESLDDAIRVIERQLGSGSNPHQGRLIFDEAIDSPDAFKSRTYIEFRNTFRRSVVLGDPGGGKSTLCQKLCFDLTQNFLASLQSSEAPQKVDDQSKKLAIRITLRNFEQARLKIPQLSIFDFLCGEIRNLSGVDLVTIEAYIRDLFETGNAVFAFDGLDEILDTSRRRDFVDLVSAFCNQYPLTPAFVTSRFVGYEDAPLPNEFSELLLSQLNDSEVSQYLNKFLKVVAGRSVKESSAEADKFMEQTAENASDLRKNPLLLGLMAFLFNVRGDVPSNRPEIYSDCSTLMFERWDKNRGITPDVPSDFERAELFSDLASKMFGDDALRAGVSRDWLKATVRTFFLGLYLDQSRAISSSKSITDFLVGRAWVMSEVGDGTFAFTHQTFLEFFFARHLDGSFDSVDGLLNELFPKIIAQEWDVVSHLALQLKTNANLRKQDEALNWLANRIRQYKSRRHSQTLRAFAARSLEYLSGSESNLLDLLKELERTPNTYGPEQIRSHLDTLNLALKSVRQRSSFVRSKLSELMAESLLSDQPIAHHLKVSFAPVPARGPRYETSRWHALKEIGERVRDLAKERIHQRAKIDGSFASLAMQWYGTYDPGTIGKFGLTEFMHDFLEYFPASGLNWIALASHEYYQSNFTSVGFDVSGLRAFLSALQDADFEHIPKLSPRPRATGEIPYEVWEQLLINDYKSSVGKGRVLAYLADYPEIPQATGFRRRGRGSSSPEKHVSKMRRIFEDISQEDPKFSARIEKFRQYIVRFRT